MSSKTRGKSASNPTRGRLAAQEMHGRSCDGDTAARSDPTEGVVRTMETEISRAALLVSVALMVALHISATSNFARTARKPRRGK